MIGLGSNKRKCELAGRLGLILVALLVHPRGLRKLHVASCMLYCEECKPPQKVAASGAFTMMESAEARALHSLHAVVANGPDAK